MPAWLVRPIRRSTLLASSVLLAVFAASLNATTVMPLNLADLCQRAHQIYRGTVLSATTGNLQVGGGQLPTVTYQVQVDEAFRGAFAVVKGVRVAEMRTIGKVQPLRYGNLLRFPALPKVPELAVGQVYLLFTTAPSSVGLSTTVGLGQGLFRISGTGPREQAVNEANNRGLVVNARPSASFRSAGSTPGSILYGELAAQIRSELQKYGRSGR